MNASEKEAFEKWKEKKRTERAEKARTITGEASSLVSGKFPKTCLFQAVSLPMSSPILLPVYDISACRVISGTIPFERPILDYYSIDADNNYATQAFATATGRDIVPVIDVLMEKTKARNKDIPGFLKGTCFR